MLALPDREAMMLFDGIGEYWGPGDYALLLPRRTPEPLAGRLAS